MDNSNNKDNTGNTGNNDNIGNNNHTDNNNSSDPSSPSQVTTSASSTSGNGTSAPKPAPFPDEVVEKMKEYLDRGEDRDFSGNASSSSLVTTAGSSSSYSSYSGSGEGTPWTNPAPFFIPVLYDTELDQLKASCMGMSIVRLRGLLNRTRTEVPQHHRTVIQEVLELKLAVHKGLYPGFGGGRHLGEDLQGGS